MHFLEPIYYNWLIVAVIFFIIEVMSFSLIFLWLGIAAVIMAAITYLFPAFSIEWQLIFFAGLSIINVLVLHRLFKRNKKNKGNVFLNNRLDGFIGQKVVIVEAIVSGRGKVKINDGLWQVTCNEAIEEGAEVIILSREGTVFHVKRA